MTSSLDLRIVNNNNLDNLMTMFNKTLVPYKSFLGYIQSFRAFAIFLVVATHTTAVFSWNNNDLIYRLLELIYSNGTVLFVFIAGYLFQHLSYKFNMRQYYISKLNNVITPYILVSIPAILFFIAFQHREVVLWHIYQKPVWMQIIYFYITGGHLAPLWFVPMIALFYIIAPLLIKADKSTWFYCCLPAFFLVSHYVGRGSVINNFMHFFSAYVFGMFCSHYKNNVNVWLCKRYFLSTIAAVYIGLIYFGLYSADIHLGSFIYFQKIFLCMLVLGIFVKLAQKSETRLAQTIANTSFGVFFIHSYVLGFAKIISNQISQLYSTHQTLINGDPFLHLLATIIVLFVSIKIVLTVQYFFDNRSRFLIGS